MSDTLLKAAQAAEVDAYIDSPEHQAWERDTVARWLGPAALERHQAQRRERLTIVRNAASGRRRAAKLLRIPPWADMQAIRAVYTQARELTRSSGTAYHVDHFYPLQGQIVSGLHVAENLQIIPGAENCRKGNRYEV